MNALKDIFSDRRRAYVHYVAVSTLALITVFTGSDPALAGLLVAVVIAIFDLGVAIAHTSSRVSYAVYGVALAIQPVGLAFQIGTGEQWAAALTLFSALLGTSLAAAKAPKPGDYDLAA